MHYQPSLNNHGLSYNPIKAIVAPRPIGWITSRDSTGRLNLAPYSFFNLLCSKPAMVMFATEEWKDTIEFISQTKEFTCNFVDRRLAEHMNATAVPLPRGSSEFDFAKLDYEASEFVQTPRVRGAITALECKLVTIQQLHLSNGQLLNSWQVIGEVAGVYIDDRYIKDGKFDFAAAKGIARAGYMDFVQADHIFEMARPEGGGNPTGS